MSLEPDYESLIGLNLLERLDLSHNNLASMPAGLLCPAVGPRVRRQQPADRGRRRRGGHRQQLDGRACGAHERRREGPRRVAGESWLRVVYVCACAFFRVFDCAFLLWAFWEGAGLGLLSWRGWQKGDCVRVVLGRS